MSITAVFIAILCVSAITSLSLHLISHHQDGLFTPGEQLHTSLASEPDQFAQEGYWGKPTSSVDWCERNYVHSYYIAEFWNSLSNIPPFIIGVLGYYYANKAIPSTSKALGKTQQGRTLQPYFIAAAYFSFIAVYTGSFAFHATLSYLGQLWDELPMIYCSLYLHFAMTYPSRPRLTGGFLIFLGVVITWFMIAFRESPFPLQFSYGMLVALMLLRAIKLVCTEREVWNYGIFQWGMISYLSGFLLWAAEQRICKHVRHLYFHAWWHMLAGLGLYMLIQFIAIWKYREMNEPFVVKSLPPSRAIECGSVHINVLPFVVRTNDAKAK